MRELLHETADLAADFLESLPDRPVFPRVEVDELRALLGGPVPEGPTDAREVVRALAEVGGAGAAIPSGRYFGFVIGGAVPAALAADWLTSTWDQNAGLYVAGPAAAVVEEVAGAWLTELLGLPAGASFGFVTGCQMAHVDRARRRPAPRARAVGLGRRARRADRRAARSACSSARSATHDRPRAPAARPRHGSLVRSPPTSRGGCAPTRCARRSRPRRADDRLRPGGRGEHRRVRPVRGDRRRGRRGRRLAARRRRLRPLGRGQPRASRTSSPAPSAPTRGRPTRTSG